MQLNELDCAANGATLTSVSLVGDEQVVLTRQELIDFALMVASVVRGKDAELLTRGDTERYIRTYPAIRSILDRRS